MTVPTPPRWSPDGQLVAAVLATPKAARGMAHLTEPDRAWVVAGLTLAGLTAKDIAGRLGCSLRLVRSIRAEDLTQVCLLMQTESRNFTDELRLERSEHQATRHQLTEVQADRDRVKRQLDNVLDAHIVGGSVRTCSKSHLMTTYNTYVQPKTGKRFCRECHRINEANRRAAAKNAGQTARVLTALP